MGRRMLSIFAILSYGGLTSPTVAAAQLDACSAVSAPKISPARSPLASEEALDRCILASGGLRLIQPHRLKTDIDSEPSLNNL